MDEGKEREEGKEERMDQEEEEEEEETRRGVIKLLIECSFFISAPLSLTSQSLTTQNWPRESTPLAPLIGFPFCCAGTAGLVSLCLSLVSFHLRIIFDQHQSSLLVTSPPVVRSPGHPSSRLQWRVMARDSRPKRCPTTFVILSKS